MPWADVSAANPDAQRRRLDDVAPHWDDGSEFGYVIVAGSEVVGAMGLGRVEIHCDEANHRSAAIPRRLGYRLDRVEDDAIAAPGESGRSMVWVFPPAPR